MLTTNKAHQRIIASENAAFGFAVKLQKGTSVRWLRDTLAPLSGTFTDIDGATTNVTLDDANSRRDIAAVGIPEQSISLDRDQYGLALYDPDGYWYQWTGENYHGIKLSVWVIFEDDTGKTPAYRVESGYCTARTRTLGKEVTVLSLQFTNDITQLETIQGMTTSRGNQRVRDADDTSHDYTGVLREVIWGGDQDATHITPPSETPAPGRPGHPSEFVFTKTIALSASDYLSTKNYTFPDKALNNIFGNFFGSYAIVPPANGFTIWGGSILDPPPMSAQVQRRWDDVNGRYSYYFEERLKVTVSVTLGSSSRTANLTYIFKGSS